MTPKWLRPYIAPMRRVLPAFSVLALVGTLLLPTDVQAQSATEKAAARALANEGEAALKKKDFATALEKFDKASRLIPDAITLTLGVARAQLGLGKLVEAKESFNVVIRTPLLPNAPPAYKAAKVEAGAEVAGLDARIGSVVIVIVGPPSPSVTIDGEPVSALLLGERRPTNPGEHLVRATAPGYRPAEAKVVVKEGSKSDLRLSLDKDAPKPTAPVVSDVPPPSPPPPPPEPTGNGLRTGAWIAAGVGVAGLAVGGVFGLLAKGKRDDVTAACGGGSKCPPSAKSTHDAFESRATISTVGFVVAGVSAAVSIPLFVLSKPAAKASAAHFVVSPSSFAVAGSF